MKEAPHVDYDGPGLILFWMIILLLAGVIAFTSTELFAYSKSCQIWKVHDSHHYLDMNIQSHE